MRITIIFLLLAVASILATVYDIHGKEITMPAIVITPITQPKAVRDEKKAAAALDAVKVFDILMAKLFIKNTYASENVLEDLKMKVRTTPIIK